MSDDFWRTVRAIHGCPETEKITTTYIGGEALGQNAGAMHSSLTPPPAPPQNSSAASFPAKLVQGAIATGAALGLVVGAALNANIFTTALTGGIGAAIGSVAVSVNKRKPEDEAKKLLLAAGDRYARIGDTDKLVAVKQILNDLEER